MLSILDRYVIRSFLYSYFVCAIALLGLTMVLDAFLRLKDFVDAAEIGGGTGVGVLSVMFAYYSVRLPILFQMVSPTVMLAAAMFCLAQLNKHNELVPMRASGISLYRTLTPLFLFAIVITGVLVVNQEVLIPSLVSRIRQTEGMLLKETDGAYVDLFLDDTLGNNWDIPHYEKNYYTMRGKLLVTSYYPESRRRKTQLVAAYAQWKKTPSDEVPRWHVCNGKETRFADTPGGERLTSEQGDYDTTFGEGDDAYVVLRPEDRCDDPFRIVSSFLPEDILQEETSILHASTATLRAEQARDPSRRDIAVAIHSRWAFPLSNIVLLLLGLPFVLGTESKSTFGGLVVCIIICGAFYGVQALSAELGKEELSPVLAAWLPIALFGPLGIFFFDSVRT